MLSLDYIGGFFDGEGCVCIYSKEGWFGVSVSVVQCNRRILEDIRATLDCGGNISERYSGVGEKRAFELQYHSAAAVKAARKLIPVLRLKRDQAEIMATFWETYGRILQDNRTKPPEERRAIEVQRYQAGLKAREAIKEARK